MHIYARVYNPAFRQLRVDANFPELDAKTFSDSFSLALDPQEAEAIVLSCNKDLDDSEKEIMQLQAHIVRHPKAAAAIEITTEILASIFEYVCESNLIQQYPWIFEKDDYGSRPTFLNLPIITYLPTLCISAVCSKWRSVAKSYPSLWSRIKLELKISSSKGPDSALHAFIAPLEIFLSRSGQNPLDIDLDVQGELGRHNTNLLDCAMDLIIQNSHRWRVVKLKGPGVIAAYIGEEDFPMLEILDIRGDLTLDQDIFQYAPNLRNLSVFQLETSKVWSQVTSLYVHETFPLAKIPDHYPHLTSLTLREFSTSFPKPPRTFDAVQDLTVIVDDCPTGQGAGLLETMLSSFTFPALTTLCISGRTSRVTYKRRWPKELFTAFISRPKCRITKLVLTAVGISDSDLISVLLLLSESLVTLGISDYIA
ncbi:hypothetical protein BT96DRAFT_935867 [Gymnopus androsaceus JB14]|uniref:F-box domain-containing protein n=1 Tax=Gymnopus androsaceus JB14 TaxID=1447944 RepID=A0A6A4I2A4_9AGAR|nr:hypothetical protein BT96DRAFT_935867 [Gymnopus androsaceus JB14]